MSAPIVNPEIPYNGEIPGGLQPGKMCRIQGVTHPNADRFNINLQVGPNSTPRDDTALHISVRLNQGYIARNTYKNGEWGDEQGSGSLPIGTAQAFEILILVEPNNYKLAVNGQHHCDFPHKIPFSEVSYLLINGDVSITLISWEASAPVLAETISQISQQNVQGSQVPQQQPGQPGPYGPPPTGYGPQGPYGPPPAGYGPPMPPGAEPQSGFNSFLEQAQTVLAGAIKSGAAEKLLSGILSTGGQQQAPQGQGYTPQNARYGIYPQLPQDENTPSYKQNPENRGAGPVESFLSGLLSGGGNNQQQSYQQPSQQSGYGYQPAQQSQGVDFRSLLAGLLAPGNNQQGNQQGGNYNQQQPYQQPSQHAGYQQTQQSQGIDLSSLLSSLLSPGTDQQGNNQQGRNQPPYSGANPTQPPASTQHPNQKNIDPDDVSDALADLIAGKGNSSQQQNQTQSAPQGGQSQQQYGQYPLPQQQQQPQEQRGPIESLLSGLLSSGGNQQTHQGPQQPHIPQVGGEGSIGGLGSMGGLLSNLAGQMLHKPRDGN